MDCSRPKRLHPKQLSQKECRLLHHAFLQAWPLVDVKPYRNLSGESGVVAYESHARSIVVEFQDGTKYEYTERSAGAEAVALMKQLAAHGRGLSTFISRVVRDSYARKLD